MTAPEALIARVRGLCHEATRAGEASPLICAALDLCESLEGEAPAPRPAPMRIYLSAPISADPDGAPARFAALADHYGIDREELPEGSG